SNQKAMAMEKHLPAIRPPQPSTDLLVKELSTALTVQEVKALSKAPKADQRAAVLSKISSLHPVLTRQECDQCLANLSLLVPSQNLSEAEMARKMDLYFGLFAMRGVTRNMLRHACAEFSMAPRINGKDKFFPDPGTLFEYMAD